VNGREAAQKQSQNEKEGLTVTQPSEAGSQR